MEVLMILMPISFVLAGSFLFMFIMNVKKGDYDDLDSPAKRILFEDENIRTRNNEQGNLK